MTHVFRRCMEPSVLRMASYMQRRKTSKEVEHVAEISRVLCCADAQNLSGGVRMRDLNPDSANVHLDRLLAPSVEEPWYRSLIQGVQDLVQPPVLPPLEVTSKPIAVQDI
jgi:hypothetical protein